MSDESTNNGCGCGTALYLFAAIYFLFSALKTNSAWHWVLGLMFAGQIVVAVKLPRFRARGVAIICFTVAAFYLQLSFADGVNLIRAAFAAFFIWFGIQQWQKGIASPFAFDAFRDDAGNPVAASGSGATPPPLPPLKKGEDVPTIEPSPLQALTRATTASDNQGSPVRASSGLLQQSLSGTFANLLSTHLRQGYSLTANPPLSYDGTDAVASALLQHGGDYVVVVEHNAPWDNDALLNWEIVVKAARADHQLRNPKIILISPEPPPTVVPQPNEHLQPSDFD